ncbi:restriction endonuclease subunit S [Marinomonas sp. UCMA 3892]|uniref:restriction endonuclease subunit S n=1 Tax=Marinomonas sp. UCMA 3892 TaxID=1972585 RepID=UPI00146F0CB2|nr:restriction endonuclease subunit S [Marinomonas sp. UCMA 3892]
MSWPMVKLGDIFEITSSKRVHQKDWREEGIPFYRAREIAVLSREGKVDNDLFIDEAMYEEYKAKFGAPEEGDILITAVGTLGLTYAVQKGERFYFKDASVIKLRKKIDVDISYIQYAIASPTVQRFIQNSSGATVGTYTISRARETEIPLPPLEEQKRIAAILDKADSVRRKRQQAIQLADDFLRSVFLDMFGDPVTNPKGWDIRPLEDCLEFLTSGSRGWAQYYSDQGSKFIRIQNVSKNRLLLEDMAYVNAPDGAESTRTRVQIGDVLLSITADLGRSAVVNDEIAGGHINQHLALLRVNQSKINSRFLSAYLSSDGGVKQFQMKNKSAVKAGLNFNDIRTLMIPIPPLNIQKKYENIYDNISIMNEHCLSSSNEIKNQIAVLSQKAFSGGL